MSGSDQDTCTAIIVLAAGYSRRMGTQKLLLPWTGQMPIIRQVMTTAFAAAHQLRSAAVAVVCNPDFPEVPAAVADLGPSVVWNPNAQEGLSTSLRTGLGWARQVKAARAVILLGDQPEVSARVIKRVADALGHAEGMMAQARYRGVPGHPVGFSDRLFSALEAASGDEGGRSILAAQGNNRRFIDVDAPALRDVDTPSDYTTRVKHIP